MHYRLLSVINYQSLKRHRYTWLVYRVWIFKYRAINHEALIVKCGVDWSIEWVDESDYLQTQMNTHEPEERKCSKVNLYSLNKPTVSHSWVLVDKQARHEFPKYILSSSWLNFMFLFFIPTLLLIHLSVPSQLAPHYNHDYDEEVWKCVAHGLKSPSILSHTHNLGNNCFYFCSTISIATRAGYYDNKPCSNYDYHWR